MPSRSPHRRPTPPPPLISRHSPSRGRLRSPDRHHVEISSLSRMHDRREFRPTVRRSRSPAPPMGRSFSPPLKRKASPSREREMSRRTKISKSPVGSRGGSDHGSYPQPPPDNVRSLPGGSERFRDREYDAAREQRALPHFRGPEGSIDFDVSELKKFTVEIVRKPVTVSDEHINRNIINPEDITVLRRPDEGARPLFRRIEPTASTSKDRSVPVDDYRRVVAHDPSRGSGHERERSRERARYSPVHYDDQRRPYYGERARSPYESRHRTPPREEYVEPREKFRERRGGSREDSRRDMEVRRREERRHTPDRIAYKEESDLRTRINEKRSDPHPRHDDREHSSRRYESERERHGRSPPSRERERKRAGSLDRHVGGSRPSRSDTWDREKDGEWRRRPHSREREDRGRDRYERSDHHEDSDRSRRSHQYKTDFEPKKFYKSYEEKEYIPPPARGRGGPPMRRGIPPMMRGRGIVRGIRGGFRGGMMGGIVRGVPRPFMPMRGFAPPRFFPPY